MNDGLSAAYEYCRVLTKREAKNFYYGFILLPPGQRRAIHAVYAFARQCDDIVDIGQAEDAAEQIEAYRAALDRGLDGQPDGPVFTALSHAVTTHNITHVLLYDLIRGVETDLAVSRYHTFEDLRGYCELVASTIGVISIEIFGYKGGDLARRHASDLGLALQLTNILRDIQEDAARDRVYLPLDDLDLFAYAVEDLCRGSVTREFRNLLGFQVERARSYYAAGRQLLPYLPKRARACVSVMAGIYSRILDDIERDPGAVFRRRVSLSTGQKLALAGRELVRSLAP